MKRSGHTIALVGAFSCLAVAAAVSLAQDRADGRRDYSHGEHASKGHFRASEMMGMDIQNHQGENVGQVNDLVIDADTGETRYVAVTYGGFLGLGDKLFAVPYQAFSCEIDPQNSEKRLLFLDVTQEQLEGAEGFDESHWPDFADSDFTSELDRRYGVERREDARRIRRGGVSVDVNRRGVSVGVGE